MTETYLSESDDKSLVTFKLNLKMAYTDFSIESILDLKEGVQQGLFRKQGVHFWLTFSQTLRHLNPELFRHYFANLMDIKTPKWTGLSHHLRGMAQMMDRTLKSRSFPERMSDILPNEDEFTDLGSEGDSNHGWEASLDFIQLEKDRLNPPDWTKKQQTQRYDPGASIRYSEYQTRELNDIFEFNKYPSSMEHSRIGDQIGLSRFQVKKWFQNRRAKERRKLRL